MLKRFLASMALTSLLLAGVLLVYWWRSNHGHADEFVLGPGSPTATTFRTSPGKVWVEVHEDQNSQIVGENRPYPFTNLLGYCLLIPGLWLAIKIRSLLPRPPGGKGERRKNSSH